MANSKPLSEVLLCYNINSYTKIYIYVASCEYSNEPSQFDISFENPNMYDQSDG